MNSGKPWWWRALQALLLFLVIALAAPAAAAVLGHLVPVILIGIVLIAVCAVLVRRL